MRRFLFRRSKSSTHLLPERDENNATDPIEPQKQCDRLWAHRIGFARQAPYNGSGSVQTSPEKPLDSTSAGITDPVLERIRQDPTPALEICGILKFVSLSAHTGGQVGEDSIENTEETMNESIMTSDKAEKILQQLKKRDQQNRKHWKPYDGPPDWSFAVLNAPTSREMRRARINVDALGRMNEVQVINPKLVREDGDPVSWISCWL
jgi:hypothetical protein